MRKFFLTDFNNETQFNTKKRYLKNGFYEVKVNDYLEKLLPTIYSITGEEAPRDLKCVLGSLLYHKEKLSCGVLQDIHDALYKFSIQKMQSLFSYKSIQFLFRFYYKTQIEGFKSRVLKNPTMAKSLEAYQQAFETLITTF